MPNRLAAWASLVLKKRQELSLHGKKPLLVGLSHKVPEAGVAFALHRDIAILRNFDDLPMENVRWVLGAADPDECTPTIGTSGMCDVPKPSAVLTEHAHGLKI
jgi:hypothetical protein